ncbi:T9SS type A sorting domain-containing protein [Flavobacterium cerinum]|uniref:T9SS type A sorting domain-containing protein n=1 Tax=Flavobacterium cerinum TaxID=2502784 RepID=A0A444HCY8_9FLAO|nr:T9SS type A sorting domain-containing protein [Flavobacterium cerinum]RWX01569.1 T9SS type A sorting domain-containing protein [Flavobacterium cerinum]
MKKYILFYAALLVGMVSYSQCDPVATLDEDFSGFNVPFGAFPQQCWTVIGSFFHTEQRGDPPNQYAQFYNAMIQNGGSYLVTPELISIDAQHQFSFDIYKVPSVNGTFNPNVMVFRVGTFNTLDNTRVFTPVSSTTNVTNNSVTHTMIIDADVNQKYIAILVSANATHMFAGIDNIKYDAVSGTEDFAKTSFTIYPNPATDRNITIDSNLDTKADVNIYTLTGMKVYTGELNNTRAQNLNLSSLSAGIYMIKVSAGNFSESKKLILR